MIEKLEAGRYFGHPRGAREVAGLTFTESTYPPECAIPAHRHENAFFYLIVEGCCEEVCGRKQEYGNPPTLVFHPPVRSTPTTGMGRGDAASTSRSTSHAWNTHDSIRRPWTA
jgi:hypothetical protein